MIGALSRFSSRPHRRGCCSSHSATSPSVFVLFAVKSGTHVTHFKTGIVFLAVEYHVPIGWLYQPFRNRQIHTLGCCAVPLSGSKTALRRDRAFCSAGRLNEPSRHHFEF